MQIQNFSLNFNSYNKINFNKSPFLIKPVSVDTVLFTGKKRNKNNGGLYHFADKLYRTDERYINSLDISNERRYVLLKLHSLRNNYHQKAYPDLYLKSFENEDCVSEESIQNIIKRNLLDGEKQHSFIYALKEFAQIDDDKWEKIKAFAFPMYQVFYETSALDFIDGYKKGEIGFDELILNYSKNKILSLFGITGAKQRAGNMKKYVEPAIEKLQKGDVQSSNLGMILDLIQDGVLSNKFLYSITLDTKLNKEAEDDLERLYFAYINGLNIEDVFVPSFEFEKEALEQIPVGEVCNIKGESHIRIKTSDKTLTHIQLSKNAYMKLFPPVQRYSAIQPDELGDCYLVAVFDSIYSNPNTRDRILRLFKENDDGSISVNFDGWQYKNGVIKERNKDEKTYTFDLLPDYNSILAETPMALRLIENAYDNNKEDGAYFDIMRRYGAFRKALKHYPDSQIIPVEGREYSKEEVLDYISKIDMLKKVSPRKNLTSYFASLAQKGKIIVIPFSNNDGTREEKIDEIIAKMKKRQYDVTRYDIKYLEYLKKRPLNSGDKNSFGYILSDEIMPWNVYNFLLSGEDENANSRYKIYRNGGNPKEIFELFKLRAEQYSTEEFIKQLNDKEMRLKYLNGKYSFAVSTKKDAKQVRNTNLVPNHCYSLCLSDNDGEIKFLIKNPHNSSQSLELNPDEIKENFDFITSAKKGGFRY